MLQVNGTVENVIGKIKGKHSDKARRLSQEFQEGEYPVDIIFAAYNAEECGLAGSIAFYEELSKQYSEFYNINMDCVGAAGKALAQKNTSENSEELYKAFRPFFDKHEIPYKDIPYAADEDGIPMGFSDHAVFQEHGHAAIILGEADIRGIPNTIRDKDISILDFPELNRLSDAVVDFIVTTKGEIF